MKVLNPRTRMISVRVSEEVYEDLEKFCNETGVRSLSDLARDAICTFIGSGSPEGSLLLRVDLLSEQMKQVRQDIDRIAAEIATRKRAVTTKRGRFGRNGRGGD